MSPTRFCKFALMNLGFCYHASPANWGQTLLCSLRHELSKVCAWAFGINCRQPLSDSGLNCMGPLTCGVFSINTVWYYKCVFTSCDWLNHTFFSPAYFIVRIQAMIYRMCKICVDRLFMLLLRLSVNSRLLVVQFWGTQQLYLDFWLCVGQYT